MSLEHYKAHLLRATVDNLDHGVMEGTLQGLCSIISHAGIFNGQHQRLDQQHGPF